ncbi:fluoride efflux transporter family protein [Corynebacterium pacaense]|uniref:fluoride efflux transporter family protein n=1 Tax=Corynebacterium pacaense TaxID=1816684 RepID=UPI0009B991E8|nr:fluoride efflux transporter family protein [Corynebacterium pacaense]
MDGVRVGAGAALGACLRLALTIVFGAGFGPSLAINIIGSFIMGYLRPGPFWGTGVLGGFTTFSTFCVLLIDAPTAPVATAYAVATVVGCVGAWLLGDRLQCSS